MSIETLTCDINLGRIFRRYSECLSDVSKVDYTAGGEPRAGFSGLTEMFNDNITVEFPSDMSVTQGFHALRDIFGDECRLSRGDNGGNDDTTCIRMLVQPKIMGLTDDQYNKMQQRGIKLLDIDYTVDARNIVTREGLLSFLGPTTAVADRGVRKVGANCLSWWGKDCDGDRVRIKVYNTFAQILESASIRVLLGSGLHHLLNGSDKADTLLSHKDHGVSRIELTFYSDKFKDMSVYHDMVHDVALRILSQCPTTSNSLSNQWKVFIASIHQTAAVYHVEAASFAYCHWWNSLTGMMQGASRTIIKSEEIPKLLGNYSFYEMPMHLITVSNSGEQYKKYIRVHGGNQITMCCGARGGLYPHGKTRKLFEYGDGVGRVSTGYIGWPSSYSYRSKALAIVEPVLDNTEDSLVLALEVLTITNRDYKKAASLLKVGVRYTVVGAGEEKFRGSMYTYVKLACGLRLRCGASLTGLVKEQQAGKKCAFDFIVDRIRNADGKEDAICSLV
jgi:hypothetical protein